ETLVERARRGDPAAFEALVLAYQALAFRTALVIAGDATDAEEAAQDAFVKAHRALGRFHADKPFRPWLLTIVANEARNRRRARRCIRRAELARLATALLPRARCQRDARRRSPAPHAQPVTRRTHPTRRAAVPAAPAERSAPWAYLRRRRRLLASLPRPAALR